MVEESGRLFYSKTTFQDSIVGPAHGIRPSDGGLYLGLSVVPEQRENQIYYRLKILVICQKSLLAISFILSRMFFR